MMRPGMLARSPGFTALVLVAALGSIGHARPDEMAQTRPAPTARAAVYRVTRLPAPRATPPSPNDRPASDGDGEQRPSIGRVEKLRLELGIEVEEVIVDGYEAGPVRALRLVKVRPGSSAGTVGLEPGDVVVTADGPQPAGDPGATARSGGRLRLAVIRSRTGRLETLPMIRLTGLAQAPMAPAKSAPVAQAPSKAMPTPDAPAAPAPTAPAPPKPPAPSVEYAPIKPFPWPPPQFSSSTVIPDNLVRKPGANESLYDVSQHLEKALKDAGYGQIGYYSIPDDPKGFVMATSLEQFAEDGSSLPDPPRWSTRVAPPRVFSLLTYLKALFGANPGHFRVIVWVVSSRSFAPDPAKPNDRGTAQRWPLEGSNGLTPDFATYPYIDGVYRCTALIYEFEQGGPDDLPKLAAPGLPAQRHLDKSNIIKGLGQ